MFLEYKMVVDFSALHILVMGDVMLDEYIMTRVQRISPEAPIPIAKVYDKGYAVGGAANVARNLAQLGCKVSLIGVKGQDSAGEKISHLLQDEGIEDAVQIFPSCSSIQKTRIMAQKQQVLRIDYEEAWSFSAKEYESMLAEVQRLVSSCQAVILSDYAKGVLSNTAEGNNLATAMISLCNALNIPVFVDPKGKDWTKYQGATCITPNAKECGEMIGYDCSENQDLERAGKAIVQQLSIEKLLITRSEKGMALCSAKEMPFYVKANAREVMDVSGAGDTSIAVLTACYALGLGWQSSVELANKAAGKVVIKSGTAPITHAEFLSLLSSRHMQSPKIVKLAELLPKVKQWQDQGKTVVFTNGYFDLLHKGHLQLLSEAASLGSKLIVGINSDASIQRAKGELHPVQDEDSRALLLAAMQHVDNVVIFDEDTPHEVVEALVPDILVKGGNHDPESIVGAQKVLAHGGKVHIVDLVQGFSAAHPALRLMKNHEEV